MSSTHFSRLVIYQLVLNADDNYFIYETPIKLYIKPL